MRTTFSPRMSLEAALRLAVSIAGNATCLWPLRDTSLFPDQTNASATMTASWEHLPALAHKLDSFPLTLMSPWPRG